MASTVLLTIGARILDLPKYAAKSLVAYVNVDPDGRLHQMSFFMTALLAVLLGAVTTIVLLARRTPRDRLKERLLHGIETIYNFPVEEYDFRFVEVKLTFHISGERSDRIDSAYQIDAKSPIQMLKKEMASPSRLSGFPVSDAWIDGKGRNILILPAVNEHTKKRWLLYFHPKISGETRFGYTIHWDGFWDPLRKERTDWFSCRFKPPTERALLEFRFDTKTLGDVTWDPRSTSYAKTEMGTKRDVSSPSTRILTAQIETPDPETLHKFMFRRGAF